MTAPSAGELDRLYNYIAAYIQRHGCGPTMRDVSRQLPAYLRQSAKLALQQLQDQGRIRLMPWNRGIALASQVIGGCQFASVAPITVDKAIDWKRLAKYFYGVAITSLQASHIARYYRTRCAETEQSTAEREANLLLALRFPEIFLDRRQALNFGNFVDIQRAKSGCKSCGAKFTKGRPNQRYCSTTCRAREKRKRRGATEHGRLLKKRQNKRYRLKHHNREMERRREWLAAKTELRRAQRQRESLRRSLRTSWRRNRQLPLSIVAIQLRQES